MPEAVLEAALASRRAAVKAPAGTGKTELIADGVIALRDRRSLILTHTHAGVQSLRNRLRAKGAAPASYHVDTIASFALRYAAAYPTISGLRTKEPTDDDWELVYPCVQNALRNHAVQRTIETSFTDLWVDEYQDCTRDQHAIVLQLANWLPCRILGDPMQAIFEFVGDLVDWRTDVESSFQDVGTLTTPWRWRNSNPALGEWLLDVRRQLQQGGGVSLDSAPVKWRPKDPSTQSRALFAALNLQGNVVALRLRDKACHKHACDTGGRFQSIEEVECRALRKLCKELDSGNGTSRAKAFVDFTSESWAKFKPALRTLRNHLAGGHPAATCRQRTHRELVEAIAGIERTPDAACVRQAIAGVEAVPEFALYRRELWTELKRVVEMVEDGTAESWSRAAWLARNRLRHAGRPNTRRALARPFLVKGLEFDHAVVLDADELSARQLYVSLTRGSKSLTILSMAHRLAPGSF